jgi:hypothetical protein
MLSRTHSIGERNLIAMATACATLEHAFHSAIETYYRVKRGVTQIVRVERVEVQPGAQAVIGVVAREWGMLVMSRCPAVWPLTDVRNVCVRSLRILEVETIDVVADRGYFKIEDIAACEKAGMTPYVPKPQRGSSVSNGFFRKDEFRRSIAWRSAWRRGPFPGALAHRRRVQNSRISVKKSAFGKAWAAAWSPAFGRECCSWFPLRLPEAG